MKIKSRILKLLIFLILIISSCSNEKIPNCNSVLAPIIKVLCEEIGVYQEFNLETGKNEYKPRLYCFAYPSGEQGVTYRIVSYNGNGEELNWGDRVAGNRVEIALNSAYLEAWPNLDGKFCKDKLSKVFRNEFVGIK